MNPTRRVLPVIASVLLVAMGFLIFRIESRAQPRIRHVFLITLENENFEKTFVNDTLAPYLADSLPKAGLLLKNYYGTAHVSLPNYIAMISGIAPTDDTQSDCRLYVEFTETGTAPDGQPKGKGCIYPSHIMTIANQLEAKGLTWKAYMEDMGNDPAREATTCGHVAIGASDTIVTAADKYVDKHNPFVYFHAIIDSATCARNVVSLLPLEDALRSANTTANFSFISPNLCHDGHTDRHCLGDENEGLKTADRFLAHLVPLITNSPAFRKDGLLIITFDEAQPSDATACCNESPGPNVTMPGGTGPGGGRVGAILLSPFMKPGTESAVPYNHYSLLRSIEDLFGLEHLGYAGQQGLASFGKDGVVTP